MNIHWTNEAYRDFSEIIEYVGEQGASAAKKILRAIEMAQETLLEFPYIGRAGRAEDTREVFLTGTPFFLVYQIQGTDIIFLTLLHFSQKWP